MLIEILSYIKTSRRGDDCLKNKQFVTYNFQVEGAHLDTWVHMEKRQVKQAAKGKESNFGQEPWL